MKEKTESVQEKKEPKDNILKKIRKHPYFAEAAILIVLIFALGGFYYYTLLESRVYIENAQISAPIISVSTLSQGILDEVTVEIGDKITKGKVIARISGDPVKSQTSGIVVDVNNVPGQIITSQSYIIKVIDPRELRLVGRIEEDKGLKDIKPGEAVKFTVDAYGSKEYEATIEKVVPTSRESDIVFSISDKRQEQEFDIIAKFDVTYYPELKNGMSAKMWVYKD